MKKLIMWLNNIWKGYSDKILHFLVGYFIASMFQLSGTYMIIPAVVAGTAKELYDTKRDNLPKTFKNIINADWACTFAGGFIATWVYGVTRMIGGLPVIGY